MQNSISINIGGISLSLILNGNFLEFAPLGKMEAFISGDNHGLPLQVHTKKFPTTHNDRLIFDSDSAWKISEKEQKVLITVRSPNPEPHMLGIFPKHFQSGDIFINRHPDFPESYLFPLSYPMGELFLMHILSSGMGMMLHAAGVIYEGKGYLFCGHGGDGKTTIARLWQGKTGAVVVNDDKVIVRKTEQGYFLYGTPWHGEGGMALPLSAPVKGIFILKQASENYLSPLQQGEAVANVLSRAFIPLWDSKRMTANLNFLGELITHIPVKQLNFLPKNSVVDYILNTIY